MIRATKAKQTACGSCIFTKYVLACPQIITKIVSQSPMIIFYRKDAMYEKQKLDQFYFSDTGRNHQCRRSGDVSCTCKTV